MGGSEVFLLNEGRAVSEQGWRIFAGALDDTDVQSAEMDGYEEPAGDKSQTEDCAQEEQNPSIHFRRV